MKTPELPCIKCQNCTFSQICEDYLFEQPLDFFIASLQRKVEIKMGSNLFSIGEPVNHLIALRSGTVNIYGENNKLVSVISPGMLVNSEDVHTGVYQSQAIAATPVSLCVLDYSRLYGLSQITTGVFSHMVHILSESSCDKSKFIHVLSQPDAARKVASLLLLLRLRNVKVEFLADTLLLPLKHKELAGMLGLSPVTLRRTLNLLEQNGVIKLEKRQVIINDVHYLESLLVSDE
ncbi:Crp/Fnr family transcriptional regulator [Mangrovibacter plantisponsor]|uniref:CRP-like cAMP-binding protein n=1 Tax=Mangrovibacter plantisponsor TaxID=451513 RepID=A0A317PYK9_9ENTR|nr:Crp/Fnr family transcriptional regulator [Mangrovibacter plantisponsor]PWW07090.1 CRP-like cAMP-binding protein [Mangrovibacter plantisponsor]